jgi:hypothetical protein
LVSGGCSTHKWDFASGPQGPDVYGLMAPRHAPRRRVENSAEMAELWMALLRDVKFTDLDDADVVAEVAGELSTFSDFRVPARPRP